MVFVEAGSEAKVRYRNDIGQRTAISFPVATLQP